MYLGSGAYFPIRPLRLLAQGPKADVQLVSWSLAAIAICQSGDQLGLRHFDFSLSFVAPIGGDSGPSGETPRCRKLQWHRANPHPKLQPRLSDVAPRHYQHVVQCWMRLPLVLESDTNFTKALAGGESAAIER